MLIHISFDLEMLIKSKVNVNANAKLNLRNTQDLPLYFIGTIGTIDFLCF